MGFNRFNTFHKTAIERISWPHAIEENSLIRWQAFILSSILMAGLALGIFALISAGVLIIKESAWGLAVVDLAGLLVCLVFLFGRRISFEIRAAGTLLGFYIIGIAVILSVGIMSGGPAWLFAFSVLAGVIMGKRAALAALLLNGVSLFTIGYLTATTSLGDGFPFFKSPQSMVAAGVNFMVLNAIAAVSVSALVRGLFHLIEKKENLAKRLIKERQQLMAIRKDLETQIRERKLAEKQLAHARKMESIGTLAGGIAHDFNNILYMILGNTELAMEDLGGRHPSYRHLIQIRDSSLRAADIVKQLLSFSSQRDQSLKPVNARDLLEKSIQFLRSSIPSNIDIQINISKQEMVILADWVQMNQVMMNLCVNAIQAMDKTQGRIEVKASKVRVQLEMAGQDHSLAPGDYLEILVSDNGPGIAPEFIDKIFDPYFTTKELGKGTGMGLAVVHGIIMNHNGVISVKSAKDLGTCFKILLPLAEEKPEKPAAAETRIHRGKGTVLFVDDEALIVDMGRKTLEHLGYSVETWLDPADALARFRSNPKGYDVVIADMTMPGMTGDLLAQKVLEIRADIPVILCSGHSDLMDDKRARDLGVSCYLMKPVSISDFSRAIRKALALKN